MRKLYLSGLLTSLIAGAVLTKSVAILTDEEMMVRFNQAKKHVKNHMKVTGQLAKDQNHLLLSSTFSEHFSNKKNRALIDTGVHVEPHNYNIGQVVVLNVKVNIGSNHYN